MIRKNVRCKKERSWGWLQGFWPNNWRDGVDSNWDGEGCEWEMRPGLWYEPCYCSWRCWTDRNLEWGGQAEAWDGCGSWYLKSWTWMAKEASEDGDRERSQGWIRGHYASDNRLERLGVNVGSQGLFSGNTSSRMWLFPVSVALCLNQKQLTLRLPVQCTNKAVGREDNGGMNIYSWQILIWIWLMF